MGAQLVVDCKKPVTGQDVMDLTMPINFPGALLQSTWTNSLSLMITL